MGSVISASLLAETPALGIDPVTTSHDSSIWHDGIAQQSFWATTDGSIMKISQIGTSQVSSIEACNTDIYSITQVSISEISRNKLGACQVGTSETSTSQIGMTEAGIAQIGSAEIGFNQVKKVQTSFSEVGSTQVNTIQDIFGGIAPITTIIVNPETTITQIDSTKISLPSSVSAVQLLNSYLSHTNTSSLTILRTGTTCAAIAFIRSQDKHRSGHYGHWRSATQRSINYRWCNISDINVLSAKTIVAIVF
jgi:hypothetical protein